MLNHHIIVSIKKRNSDEVYKHAYIRAGESFTFNLPNGTYQPYFYYGKGWYPNKFMKNTDCGTLNGGFISQESVGTDKNPPYIKNQILEYELIEQIKKGKVTMFGDEVDATKFPRTLDQITAEPELIILRQQLEGSEIGTKLIEDIQQTKLKTYLKPRSKLSRKLSMRGNY